MRDGQVCLEIFHCGQGDTGYLNAVCRLGTKQGASQKGASSYVQAARRLQTLRFDPLEAIRD